MGSSDEDPEHERELVHAFCGRRVDGPVLASVARDQTYLLRDVRAGMAVVFIDRAPEAIEADTVLIDNAGAAAAAVDHLVGSGHTRIAFLGDREQIFTTRERRAGYRDALARHLVRYDPDLVQGGLDSSDSAFEATRSLLALGRAADSPAGQPEPDHLGRRAPCRPTLASTTWPWWASTT